MNTCLNAARLARAAALPLTLVLAACGGGSDATLSTSPPPLFDEAGSALQASATEEQLQWQELVSSPTTVVIDVDRLGAPAALAQAQVVRAFHPLPGTVWFVRGAVAQDTALVADALREQAVGLVFLVR